MVVAIVLIKMMILIKVRIMVSNWVVVSVVSIIMVWCFVTMHCVQFMVSHISMEIAVMMVIMMVHWLHFQDQITS